MQFKSLNSFAAALAILGMSATLPSIALAQSMSDYHQSWGDYYNDTADWHQYHNNSSWETYYRQGAETQYNNSDYYNSY